MGRCWQARRPQGGLGAGPHDLRASSRASSGALHAVLRVRLASSPTTSGRKPGGAISSGRPATISKVPACRCTFVPLWAASLDSTPPSRPDRSPGLDEPTRAATWSEANSMSRPSLRCPPPRMQFAVWRAQAPRMAASPTEDATSVAQAQIEALELQTRREKRSAPLRPSPPRFGPR